MAATLTLAGHLISRPAASVAVNELTMPCHALAVLPAWLEQRYVNAFITGDTTLIVGSGYCWSIRCRGVRCHWIALMTTADLE